MGRSSAAADAPPHVVLLIGEDEYQTEKTLPAFADAELASRGLRLTAVHSDVQDPNRFPDLANALDQADLLVVSVRRRTPPAEQLQRIRTYIEAGKPVVGIRTASHAFSLRSNQPPPAGHAAWPEFDARVLGGHYTNHHPAPTENARTIVWIKDEAKTHPILVGLPQGEWSVGSSLYKTRPLGESTKVLLMGRFEGGQTAEDRAAEPVAWTNTDYRGGRVFYTSLGHPDDFKIAAFRRLLLNGVFWALDRTVPDKKN
ncbi:MAG TPA: ThuA domain-containing protein [Pirellulales bacterium]|nr:ThuA domain-containing protein [Pirellulales bacterium]